MAAGCKAGVSGTAAVVGMMRDMDKKLDVVPETFEMAAAYFQCLVDGLNGSTKDYCAVYGFCRRLCRAMVRACGVVKVVVFVCSGVGVVEYGLALMLRRVAKSYPEFRGSAGEFCVVITDGQIGPTAPGDKLPPFVVKMTAEDAVKEHGGEYTAVFVVKPPPDGLAPVPMNLAEVAKETGTPFVGVFMDLPTSKFLGDELKEHVARLMTRGIPEELCDTLVSLIAQDDEKPRSDMMRCDWNDIHRHFIRFDILAAAEQHDGKLMAWVCFVLRPPSSNPPLKVEEAPLPMLSGDRLQCLLSKLGDMAMMSCTRVGL